MSDVEDGHEIRIPDSVPSQANDGDDAKLQPKAQSHMSGISSACAYAPLCPISRIPPEILLTIFKLVATVDPPHRRYIELVRYIRHYDDKPSSLGWIRVSHVNRRWRILCLKTPGLWAMHVGIFLEAVPIFLERAGENVPLHILIQPSSLDPGPRENFDLFLLRDLIMKDRIGGLTLSTVKLDTTEYLRANFPSAPLPSLRLLDVEYVGRRNLGASHARLDGPLATLPFAETISFNYCFIPFAAPALTTFSLKCVGIDCSYLLEVLSRTTMLEWLNITTCHLTRDLDGCEVVSLPRLKKLLARIQHDGMFNRTKAGLYRGFIEHLLLSPRTLLDLEYSSAFGEDAEDLNYIVTGVQYVWREDPPRGMRFYKSDLEFYSGPLSELPLNQSLTKPFPDPEDEDLKWLDSRAMFYAFPPWKFAEGLRGSLTVHTQLTSITVFSAPLNSWKTRDWATILRTLPNLVTLHLLYTKRYNRYDSEDEGAEERLHEDETYWPFMAMGSPPTFWENQPFFGSPADPSALLVPQLDMLWLSKDREDVRQEDINQPRLLMYLRDALEARAERNARPLSMVRLDIIAQPGEGQRGHADADIVRRLVQDIRWRASGGGDLVEEGSDEGAGTN